MMKFKFVPSVQEYDYSCLDELRIDLIQTMDYLTKEKNRDEWVSFISSSDRAIEFFDLLKESVYNDTQFELCADYELFYEEELQSDVVIITINPDSEILVEGLDMSLNGVMPFIMIDKSLSNYSEIVERYSTSEDDSADYILGFTIE